MWQLCCRSTDGGFVCEIPAGEYVIGTPDEMLLSGVLKTLSLRSGCFEQTEKDGIIVLHTFTKSDLTVYINGVASNIFSETGCIAIMSSNIVKPLPEFNKFRFDCTKRALVELNENLTLRCDDLIVCAEEEDFPKETDEQMHANAYESIGVRY